MLGPQRRGGAGTLVTARRVTSLTHGPQGTETRGLPSQTGAGQVVAVTGLEMAG